MKIFGITVIIVLLNACGSNSSLTDETSNEVVFIGNNSKQCFIEGDPPEITAEPLIEAGIEVIGSKCGFQTQLAVCEACGCPTTEINLHTIREVNLSDAEELGYQSVSTLDNEFDAGYQEIDCK